MKPLSLLLGLIFMSNLLFAQEIDLEVFATGFSSPVDISNAGDDRLFIVERAGRIKIVDAQGGNLGTFLDITSQVNNSPNERGLLGLEFHPDYANNGYFYVNYTKNNGDTRISRFSVDSNDPDQADSNSEVILMEVNQPEWNHNAGDLEFGPDGYLYIGTGDGGGGGDPDNYSQNTQSLLGKMLRIDVDNGMPYSIPADNPFVNDANVLDEIWSIGLRNPWRYSFDSETGDLWIADVGQNQWEEINLEPAGSQGGLNYGWRCYEGNNTYNTSGCGSASNYTNPVHDYNHQGFTHCSVTGGFVYRGCESPDLVGHYLYADYCSGRFWSLSKDANGDYVNVTVANYGGYDISTFGEDVKGEMYVARLGNGAIYKIVSDNPFVLEITQTDNTLSGPSGFETYQWFLDGEAIAGATSMDYEITESGEYTLEVTTVTGCTYSALFTGVVALDEIVSLDLFEITPNPFSNELRINMEANRNLDVTLQVMNINGKVLWSKDLNVSGQATELVKLNNLSAGVYLVQIQTDEGMLTRKVVKE